LLVADWVEYRVHPKTAAVLPNAPTLRLVTAFTGGGFEGAQMFFSTPVLVGVEDGKILPDDFMGAVAFDALGPGIPRPNMALGIQHVDSVVRHGLDEHIQLSLGIRDLLPKL